jgi:hypothetical protein
LEVLTEQNRQPRVHVSPMSIMVAVAFDLSEPPQQSPMLGHLASSQTVCSFSPRRSSLILVNDAPVGIFVFKNEGSRGWEAFPKMTVSTSGPARTKSSRPGPASSFCLKVDACVASDLETENSAERCFTVVDRSIVGGQGARGRISDHWDDDYPEDESVS